VSLGTSLPELIISIISILNGSSEIVIGNVIGSNITNTFLILGVMAIVGKQLRMKYENIHLNFLIGATFLLLIIAWNRKIVLFEAVILLLMCILYLRSTLTLERRREQRAYEESQTERKTKKLNKKTIITLISTPILIYFGAQYTVTSIIELSRIFNIGTEVIAASAVAFGTSLPELAITLSITKKGQLEIAVGNVLGSNVFNILLVIGVSGLIGRILIPQHMLVFDLPVLLIATLLFFFITRDRDISKWEGYMLVIFYVLFIGKILNLI
jgi:cation:H+ antiporter